MKIKKVLYSLAVLIPLITFWSCSSDSPTDPNPNPRPDNSAVVSKLSDIQVKVFNQNCAFSSCHATPNNQANLLLTEGNSFSNLVNVQSLLFPQYKRVEPGNSSNSLIIKILMGEVSPRMPLNKDPLPAAVIDSIANWIDNGALNN